MNSKKNNEDRQRNGAFTEIDWEKRNWKRILTPEEEREIAAKMLRLNGGPDYDPPTERLLAASSKKKKPTFRIRRLSSKLQGGSTLQRLLLERARESRKSFEIKQWTI